MFWASLAHHQEVHSCIKELFNLFIISSYVVQLSKIHQCMIYGRWICALKIMKLLGYKNSLKLQNIWLLQLLHV